MPALAEPVGRLTHLPAFDDRDPRATELTLGRGLEGGHAPSRGAVSRSRPVPVSGMAMRSMSRFDLRAIASIAAIFAGRLPLKAAPPPHPVGPPIPDGQGPRPRALYQWGRNISDPRTHLVFTYLPAIDRSRRLILSTARPTRKYSPSSECRRGLSVVERAGSPLRGAVESHVFTMRRKPC
jgi:hypothetical protein